MAQTLETLKTPTPENIAYTASWGSILQALKEMDLTNSDNGTVVTKNAPAVEVVEKPKERVFDGKLRGGARYQYTQPKPGQELIVSFEGEGEARMGDQVRVIAYGGVKGEKPGPISTTGVFNLGKEIGERYQVQGSVSLTIPASWDTNIIVTVRPEADGFIFDHSFTAVLKDILGIYDPAKKDLGVQFPSPELATRLVQDLLIIWHHFVFRANLPFQEKNIYSYSEGGTSKVSTAYLKGRFETNTEHLLGVLKVDSFNSIERSTLLQQYRSIAQAMHSVITDLTMLQEMYGARGRTIQKVMNKPVAVENPEGSITRKSMHWTAKRKLNREQENYFEALETDSNLEEDFDDNSVGDVFVEDNQTQSALPTLSELAEIELDLPANQEIKNGTTGTGIEFSYYQPKPGEALVITFKSKDRTAIGDKVRVRIDGYSAHGTTDGKLQPRHISRTIELKRNPLPSDDEKDSATVQTFVIPIPKSWEVDFSVDIKEEAWQYFYDERTMSIMTVLRKAFGIDSHVSSLQENQYPKIPDQNEVTPLIMDLVPLANEFLRRANLPASKVIRMNSSAEFDAAARARLEASAKKVFELFLGFPSEMGDGFSSRETYQKIVGEYAAGLKNLVSELKILRAHNMKQKSQ
jgi:hypothetical protein